MLSRDNPEVQCLHCGSFYVPGQPNHDRARIEALETALRKIAKHPEKKTDGASTYAVGWAFWNVQCIAEAALQPPRGQP